MSTKKLVTILILANSFALSMVISIWLYQVSDNKAEAIIDAVLALAFISTIVIVIIASFNKDVKDFIDNL